MEGLKALNRMRHREENTLKKRKILRNVEERARMVKHTFNQSSRSLIKNSEM